MFKLIALVLVVGTLLVAPVLHQDFPNSSSVHFSVVTCLLNDIACRDFLTPSFIADEIREVL